MSANDSTQGVSDACLAMLRGEQSIEIQGLFRYESTQRVAAMAVECGYKSIAALALERARAERIGSIVVNPCTQSMVEFLVSFKDVVVLAGTSPCLFNWLIPALREGLGFFDMSEVVDQVIASDRVDLALELAEWHRSKRLPRSNYYVRAPKSLKMLEIMLPLVTSEVSTLWYDSISCDMVEAMPESPWQSTTPLQTFSFDLFEYCLLRSPKYSMVANKNMLEWNRILGRIVGSFRECSSAHAKYAVAKVQLLIETMRKHSMSIVVEMIPETIGVYCLRMIIEGFQLGPGQMTQLLLRMCRAYSSFSSECIRLVIERGAMVSEPVMVDGSEYVIARDASERILVEIRRFEQMKCG